MNVNVDLDDLLAANEWVKAGAAAFVQAEAFIGRKDGRIVWRGEGVGDDLVPDDADDRSAWIPVPTARDLERASSLPVRFVEQHLPGSVDTVEDYFRKRGAWSRFKSLLGAHGLLAAWHVYEEAAIDQSLIQWCNEHGFEATRSKAR